MTRAVVAGVLLAVLTATSACGGRGADAGPASAPPSSPPVGTRLVLVSGRDDHGMVSLEQVPVYDAPAGGHVTGRIPDATLARVVQEDGTWLEVRTAVGRPVTGWVDDFYLRGVVRLVGQAPPCRVRLAGRSEQGGTLAVVDDVRRARARVHLDADPSVRGWVRVRDLQELPPQGRRCGDIPPDDKHAHEH